MNIKAFVTGTVFGLLLATVGVSGITKILEHGVATVKEKSIEMAK